MIKAGSVKVFQITNVFIFIRFDREGASASDVRSHSVSESSVQQIYRIFIATIGGFWVRTQRKVSYNITGYITVFT